MSSLRIYLFSPFELIHGDTPLSVPPSKSARSLLAYLILHHDQTISRDRLAGTFWPERPETRARRALSQALWHIRSALEAAEDRLVTDRDTVTFALSPDDWLDVETFTQYIYRYTDPSPQSNLASSSPDAQLEALKKAVALYRDDLLQENYDDWALLERERLRELFLEALHHLLTFYKQQNGFERALTYAQRLAAVDPLRESAHQELMRLYYLLGRPEAALEQFATLRDLLAQELDAPPTPATIALYQEIVDSMDALSPPFLPGAPPPPPVLRELTHLPFVGRTNERSMLLYALQTATKGNGGGGMALIEGEAGVGKTRLVNEIIADAEWRGVQVGVGKIDPLTASIPYHPFREALSPLLTPLRVAQLAKLIEPAKLSAIVPLFPSVAEHTPDLPPLVSLEPSEKQRRLFEGLAEGIAGLTLVAPLLLVLEDVHWADEATLGAILRLASTLTEYRVLLILTYRSAEARENSIVWETLETLDRTLSPHRLCLSPFGREEAYTLVRRALDVGEDDTQATDLARQLHDETRGNALFLVETLTSLLEQGSLAPSHDSGWTYPTPDQALPAPASVYQLIGGRLDRLPVLPRSVLEMIAVLGEEASFAILSAASQMEVPTLLATLEELGQRGFLVETEAHYRFEHDQIKETVYQSIEPSHRQELHRHAGAVIEHLAPEAVESLAYHFTQGETWEKALIYNERAGDRARAIYAGGEAIAYYGRALAAWEHRESHDLEAARALHQKRGALGQETGRFDQAEVDLRAAHALAVDMKDERAQCLALNHLSYLQFQRGDYETAIETAEQALDLATAAGLRREMATGLFNQANALRNSGHFSQSIRLYQQAAAIFEQLDEQTHLADCVNRMGYAILFIGDHDRAQEAMERGLAIRRRLDDKVGIAYSLINLAGLYYRRGSFPRMKKCAQEALDVSRTAGDPYGEDAALNLIGMAALEMGHPAEALPIFHQAMAIGTRIGDRPLETGTMAEMGRAHHQLGDLEQARKLLEECFNQARIIIEQNELPAIYAYVTQVLLDAGCREEALTRGRAGLHVAEEIEEPWSLGVIHRVVGKVAEQLADPAEAGVDPAFHFQESIRVLRETGAVAELGRSLAAYGRYLQNSDAIDGKQRGAALLDEARQLFKQCAMARDLALLDADASFLPPGKIQTRLPHAEAPTGRPLREEEWVNVTWTTDAPEDRQVAGKVARRRHRLRRLLDEAADQEAAPTVATLAEVLDVSPRTIKRDLAALREEGWDVETRGTRAG